MTSGLSAGAARLHLQLLAALLEGGEALLGVAGQVHVHAGPHARAQVGGAAVDVAVLGVQHELAPALRAHAVAHGLDAARETVEDGAHVAAALHGDDAQLVLLVHPNLVK